MNRANRPALRGRAFLALALLLVPGLAPLASANHLSREDAGSAGPSVTLPRLPVPPLVEPPSRIILPDAMDILENDTDTLPAVDAIRDLLIARQRGSVDELNRELSSRNASPHGFSPAVPGRVMFDPVEPGARIGGIGDYGVVGGHWNVNLAGGRNQTAGYVMTDATGRYGTMDAYLVTPAIDLSAYALNTGTLPFGGAGPNDVISQAYANDVNLGAAGGEAGVFVDEARAAKFLTDQINLLITHRYNLNDGVDGAQVRVFSEHPPASTKERGTLVRPIPMPTSPEFDPVRTLNTFGNSFVNSPSTEHLPDMGTSDFMAGYSTDVRMLGAEPGFSGAQDWDVAAFDLTPWAGKTIWIAFHVRTSFQASADSGYFSQPGIKQDMPPGWAVDDIEVVAPAYGKNLKVYAIDGPGYRIDEKDLVDRVAPGANVTLGAVVLNAGGTAGPARVALRLSGGVTGEFVHEKTLQPGEVWVPNVTVRTPETQNETFTLTAVATNIGPNGVGVTDPTLDNRDQRTWAVTALPRQEAELRVDRVMVDDNEPAVAYGWVNNTGNTPLTVHVTLTEDSLAVDPVTGNRTVPVRLHHPETNVTVPVGGSHALTWALRGDNRGEHVLNMTAVALDTLPGLAQARYYVHASPPPLLSVDAQAPPDLAAWDRVLASYPVPPYDDSVWATGGTPGPQPYVLRAVPLGDVNLGGYRDLRLSMRYMAYAREGFGGVSIGYAGTSATESDLPPTRVDVARVMFPLGQAKGLANHVNLSWQTVTAEVQPQHSRGYADVWSLKGMELRVEVPANSAAGNAFYLDDLRLTGVPADGDHADRRDIIRITGNDSAAYVAPVHPTVDAVVAPNTQPTAPGPAGVCTPQAQNNCWTTINSAQLKALASASRWRTALPLETVDGSVPAWRYNTTAGRVQAPDRLVTPPLRLNAAEDPHLLMDHAYAMASFPLDTSKDSIYAIRQIGFVEMQYLRDDGTWSRFIRLVPEGGYPSPLHFNLNMSPRRADTGQGAFFSGEGFYHPVRCVTSLPENCDANGYFKNMRWDGVYQWMDFEPTPHREFSVFRLATQEALADHDVDLSNAVIRLGFHATEGPSSNDIGSWSIMGVRVVPTNKFAVDAAVADLKPETEYDWRKLGLPGGEAILANVTVRNEGRFPDAFSVRVGYGAVGESLVHTEPVDLGVIPPGENVTALVPFNVSIELQGRALVLSAETMPTDNRTLDDNPYNDVRTIGRETPIRVTPVRDLAVRGGVYPPEGDPTLPRLITLTLANVGNTPLKDIEVERLIERFDADGVKVVEQKVWPVTELTPDPDGVSLLRANPEVRESELSFTPGLQGTYLVTVTVRTKDVTDDNPVDNVFRRYVTAAVPLMEEEFEGVLRWDTNDPNTWGQGPGFRSDRALVARNATSGLLTPGLDAWITTTPLPLSDLQAATVSLVTKYDLERGYDGAVLEISTDNLTWHRVPPVDEFGRARPYPVELVRSNPLAAGVDENEPVLALSGSSWDEPVQFDGWTPMTFDLANVKNLSETLVFKSLQTPTPTTPTIESIDPRGKLRYSAWMVVDAADEAGRWEIRNERVIPEIDRWWSGLAASQLNRSMNRTFDVSAAPAESVLTLTWWDRRAGTANSSFDGVGALYAVKIKERSGPAYHLNASTTILARDGDWTLRRAILPATLDRARTFDLAFEMLSMDASANGMGWELRDVKLQAFPAANGRPIPGRDALMSFTGDETSALERANWNNSFMRVRDVSTPASPWSAVTGAGPDGRQTPLWSLQLRNTPDHRNVDTRLVTPVVDLGTVGGGRSSLRVTHSYNLLYREDPLLSGRQLWMSKFYQAGAVEIEVFNRTTGGWDAPRQLFAANAPTPEVVPRDVDGDRMPDDGAPYPVTLVEAGDSFQRFPRSILQLINKVGFGAQYYRDFSDPAPRVSYAFSGDSMGWVTDEFDLSPYRGEKVRFVFHAWTGNTNAGERHWTIASADVIGTVLSTTDARLRFRLGTDASILDGEWAVDQFQLSGVRYQRSVGVHITEKPVEAAPNGTYLVKGFLRNYGSGTRDDVAVGVRVRGVADTAPRVVAAAPTPRLGDGVAGYVEALGPFTLAPAGKPGSEVAFEARIHANATEGLHGITFELLDADIESGALGYAPARDDVPGRASRTWLLETHARPAAEVERVTFDPPILPRAGVASANVSVENTGTTALNLSARVSVFKIGESAPVSQKTTTPRALAPGAKAVLTVPPLTFATAEHYKVRVELRDGADPLGEPVTLPYRVGTNDTVYVADFEAGFESWEAGEANTLPVRLATDKTRFGKHGILFGATEQEYASGARLENMVIPGMVPLATFTSPPLDLRPLGASPELTFWHLPHLLIHANVQLQYRVLRETGTDAMPGCSEWRTLMGHEELGGWEPDWRLVRVPLGDLKACELGPLTDHRIELRFIMGQARGQGWRIDALTLVSGLPVIDPAERRHPISDGGLKVYPFTVTNPGSAPRDLRLSVDPGFSKLSPSQLEWVRVEPPAVRLDPGQSASGTLYVDAPATRGGFAQDLAVSLVAVDPTLPFVLPNSTLGLDFRPQPRADLVLTAAIDGKALGGDPLPVEEATSHEVSVLVSNDGVEASLPTEVRMRILDAKGAVVWEQRQRVEAVEPTARGGATEVAAGTWKPVLGARGSYTFEAVVDPERRQVDYDRANSVLSAPLRVTPLMRPDLAVHARNMALTTVEGKPLHETTPGQIVRVSGVVVNEGLAEARQVTVRLVAGSAVLKEEVVPSLMPGAAYAIFANQRAGAEPTTYRLIAFTPDVEVRSDNNEQGIDLEVYPPEIEIEVSPDALTLAPGEVRMLPATVSNRGPYPLLLTLATAGDARLGNLSATRFALAPNETRKLDLTLTASSSEMAGARKVLVQAESSEGLRARRTVVVEVEPRPAVALLTHAARGPPQALTLDVDLVNTGNVELTPEAVVRDASGKVLLRETVEPVPPGGSRLLKLPVRLPLDTPPGLAPLSVTVEQDERTVGVGEAAVQVEPWGRVSARTTVLDATAATTRYAVTLTYEGNAPGVRHPVLLNAPEGVTGRYDAKTLELKPGETRNLTLDIKKSAEVRSGRYLLQMGFLDPRDPEGRSLLGNLTSLPLDLRRSQLELVGVKREGSALPVAGEELAYVATIRNLGDSPTGKVPVLLYVDGRLVERVEFDSLAPGATREVRLRHEPVAGLRGIVVAVDPHGPHRNDTTAFAESLDVAAALGGGIEGLSRIPAPSWTLFVALFAVAALALPRRGGRRDG